MIITIEKNEEGYVTKITPATGLEAKFDYITFLKEMYTTNGVYSLSYKGEISEEEQDLLSNTFEKIAEIFRKSADEIPF